MKTIKKIITLSIAALLLTALGTNISFAGKPTGGGGGKKVTVEAVNPSSATQGEDPTVTIMGSGFDDGSSVKFLVTGTTDESQIVVASVTYVSPSELKAHIKTNGSTAPVDYDIEVQAASGRKGKGTTLFKVQKVGEDCTDLEPTMAVRDSFKFVGSDLTENIRLSSASGCSEIVLVEDLTHDEAGGDLRYVARGQQAFVVWSGNNDVNQIWGLAFTINADYSVTLDPGGKRLLYSSGAGFFVAGLDVHINAAGEVLVVFNEHFGTGDLSTDPDTWREVKLINVTKSTISTILDGKCQVQNQGDCFIASYSDMRFDPTGEIIYFDARRYPDTERRGIARIHKTEAGWGQAELIVEGGAYKASISLDGLLAYQFEAFTCNKNGRRCGFDGTRIGVLDPEDCLVNLCQGIDGDPDQSRYGGAPSWTSNDTILFGSDGGTREYTDPFNDELRELFIGDVVYLDTDL